MDNNKLIHLVRKNSEIFDHSNLLNRNREHIMEVWSNIAKELNTTDVAAKKRWCNLRSNFMREKRRLQRKLEEGSSQRTIIWPYYKLLTFLDNIGQSVNPLISQETPICDQFSSENDSLSYYDDETGNELIEEKYQPPQVNNTELPTSNKRKFEIPNIDDNKDKSYANTFKRSCLSRDDEYNDPDFLFLRSILPMVKKLGIFESLEFKAEVIQILKIKLQLSQNRNSQQCHFQSAEDNLIQSDSKSIPSTTLHDSDHN